MESLDVIYQVKKSDLEALLQAAVKAAMEENPIKTNRLYTDAELQKHANVSRIKLWQDRKSGRLKFVRIGNMIRYREQDIQEYLQSNK